MVTIIYQRHQVIAGIFVVVLGFRISASRPTKIGPLDNTVWVFNHTRLAVDIDTTVLWLEIGHRPLSVHIVM